MAQMFDQQTGQPIDFSPNRLIQRLQQPSVPFNLPLAMGLGILASPTGQGSSLSGISRGVMSGVDLFQQLQANDERRAASAYDLAGAEEQRQNARQDRASARDERGQRSEATQLTAQMLERGDINGAISSLARIDPGQAVSLGANMQGQAAEAAGKGAQGQRAEGVAMQIIQERMQKEGRDTLRPEEWSALGSIRGGKIKEGFEFLTPKPMNVDIGVGGDQMQRTLVNPYNPSQRTDLGSPYSRQSSSTNIEMLGEKRTVTARADSMAKQYDGLAERRQATLPLLDNLYAAQNISTQFGALEPLKSKASALLDAMGVDPTKMGLQDATTPQAFVGLMQSVVLNKMQAQKGPQTENDAKRIESTVASLGNTEEAANFLLRAEIAFREKDAEEADFWDEWFTQKGSYEGASAAWKAKWSKTPMVGKSPNSKLPLFFGEFRKANAGIPYEDVVKEWNSRYAK